MTAAARRYYFLALFAGFCGGWARSFWAALALLVIAGGAAVYAAAVDRDD